MVHCSLCNRTYDKGTKCVRVPQKAEKRKLWTESVGLVIKENTRICEKHFKDSDFYFASGNCGSKRRRLRAGATPHSSIPAFRYTEHLISSLDSSRKDFNSQVDSAPDIVKIGDIKLKEWEDNVSPQRRRVSQVHLHPLYNSSYYYHDIGLVQLDGAIEYTWFVRPVRLWVRNEIPYEKLHSMGYGATGFAQAPTNVLTELELSEVPQQQCNSALPFDESAPKGIVGSQICAHDYEKNRDTCQGDSGGPLQLNLERRKRRHRHKRRYRYYLVGITSYGTFCRSEHPGVYTRVSSYVDWITSIVWPDYYSEFDKTT